MRFRFISVLLVGLALSFLACGVGGPGGPGGTVRKFYHYVEAGDSEKAVSLFSQDAMKSLGRDKIEAAIAMNTTMIKAMGGVKSLKFENETINGDTAEVSVTVVFGNGESSTETVKLVREGGAWKLRPSK